jgi:mannose-6-phosphate isomerase-like protein (cupin superfamily)
MFFAKVKRVWGHYRVIFSCPWIKVKVLKFLPYKHLSFQKHWYRNELWVCLYGSGGKVVKQWEAKKHRVYKPFSFGKVFLIKRKYWHQLMNVGNGFIYVLEIQFGRLVDEEDIIRKS